MTIRSILCSVDFSDQSRHALRWAATLAVRSHGQLTVLTAVDPLLSQAALTRFNLDLSRETETELRQFVAATLPGRESWLPEIGIDVRVGPAADVILDTADRVHADLIAMGTHGLGGFRKLLLGSTTERVLRRARSALLAVPHVDPELVVVEASGPRVSVKAVLMATDFSEAASDALRYAVDLTRQLAVPLVLAHVVAPVPVSPRWESYVEGIDEERVAQARAWLGKMSGDLPDPASTRVVVSVGRPADSIAATAQEQDAGLIVMGLVGERGPLAPRPGATAYRVVCLAHVPVLVVSPRTSVEHPPEPPSP